MLQIRSLPLTIFILLASLTFGMAQKQEKVPVGEIKTPYGKILISLDDRTPNHRDSFIDLANAGYWDTLTFNRVIPNFVNQGGCPDTPEGFNDPEYLLAPEITPELTHKYGAVGAGRDGNPQKISARCQFYIIQNPEGVHRLDGDYTVFGHVIDGMDVVEKIANAPTNDKDEPLEPVNMKIKIKYLSGSKIEKLQK
ncbi:peptidylprolyl isomerase [Algoriphagus pacificus]|uniref:Peptidyl-prolyl cis-trans isomerase n=1 Tax=Algoriphagus pacificus TaxID=2811234 RepID=A0ABS3CFI8_9BACT|nr:peptidylprolyl isomerase [Algoriphagus pacificus]